MNRRHKKKQQTDYLALIQSKWAAIDFQFDWRQFQQKVVQFWQRLPKLHQRALMVLVPVVLILMVIPLPQHSAEAPQTPASGQRVEVNINTRGLSEQQSAEQSKLKSTAWHEYIVQQGDTLSQVFRNNELPMADLNDLVKIEGSDKPLSQIQQGQLIRFKLSSEGKLDILQLEKNNQSVMFFRLSDGGFGRSK
ncbi:LysM-like peptidoglycan-binding domain-containing protein [Vibrio fluvialis]|uniref:LysM-like peptidoglycan-binding domain-containing protein n=1 Tax=Vibrio fluvialis TaxID=676 RepID=UPI001C9D5A3E|nr:LysM-like peptidoglycan-binding domain-containing protein [Vibrio fluvialis]EKO3387039.1 lysine transporter LysM [Vibrio fluvialis]ELD1799679.1 lysine transporter LysM [Vibrio fluvialis]MBY7936866.1 lysine transporter LysM [Vibrio fluvialis]MCE7581861.1 lysine transporter LysM [Vibrio fluvialis]